MTTITMSQKQTQHEKMLVDLESQLDRQGYKNTTHPTQSTYGNLLGMLFHRWTCANKMAEAYDWQDEAKNALSDKYGEEMDSVKKLVKEMTAKKIVAAGKCGPDLTGSKEWTIENARFGASIYSCNKIADDAYKQNAERRKQQLNERGTTHAPAEF